MPDLRNPRPHRLIDDVRDGNDDNPTVRKAHATMRKALDGFHDGACDATDCGLTDLAAEYRMQERVLDGELANRLRAMAARST
jgi:phytoene/squalene synthetase